MPDEHNYIQLNREQRERLTRLVETLSDTQLAQPLGGGWTVSTILAHCAFWDRYALLHWEIWERDGMKPLPVDVESLNSAGFPGWLALPPRIAAAQAQEAAEAIDHKVENLDPALVEKFLAEKYGLWRLHTYEHRGEHLDDLEKALAKQH
ncbi:MAG: DinB family protein [Chloroflexia bacterium]